ncbi:MAG: CotH kinase family protein [Muribaculaceae bacterium]|nr:CotH kinase family protein [Muribaculaceae bacterium]
MKELLICLASLCAILATAQQNVCVYVNHSTFHQIKPEDGIWLNHTVNNDSVFVSFKDWITGEQTLPVSVVDSCVVRQNDIPVLRFSFPDYPDVDYLWEKELYLDACLSIEGNGMVEDEEELSLKVKGRGNSTWGMPKKPMRLKFSKKTSICGFKKAKNYVLLNNYLDPTMMRNVLAMWLAKRLGVPYANTMVPCHVFINGHYSGAYTLTEKVGINSGSVEIEETEGILFELSTEYDEKYKFRSEVWDLPVMVKDPDFDELYEDDPEGLTPEERLALWQEDFNRAEAAVKEGRADEAFDMESAVNYFILYEFVKNSEIGYPKSFYLHKNSLAEGEKYYFGPAWDFDVAFNLLVVRDGVANPASPEGDIWVNALIGEMTDSEAFQNLYKERRKIFQEEFFPEMLEYLDTYAALIEPSAKLNGLRWPDSGFYSSWTFVEPSFDTKRHVAELREWLIQRAEYLRKRDI